MTALSLACIGAQTGRAADEPAPPTAIQFTLDRPLDASDAPFVLASSRGLFRAEGLAVATKIASGPADAIARVASGSSDLALVDINVLIRFRDKADAAPVKAVFVLFNKAPYAIIARKSRGIRALSDIEGKTLGVAEGDFSIWFWPALAHQNGIKLASVKLNKISPAVREPILSAGQVDAVTGFSYLAGVNLKDRGIPADDLAVLRFADYGCEAYGFALIVNPAFAARKPEAVKGFLRAVIAGTRLAIEDPARAVDDVLTQMELWNARSRTRTPARRHRRQYPDRRSQAQRHRRHRSGPFRAIGRSARRGCQIPRQAGAGGYFRRFVPAGIQRPPDQLNK